MVRVFHHYVSGRKALFFFAEAGAIGAACVGGAAAVSAAMSPASGEWLARARGLPWLALGFAAALQFVLYLLDLYDLRVAAEDRLRGARALRAAGLGVVLMGLGAVVAPSGWLPSGALLGGAIGAVLGSFVVRAAMGAVVGRPKRVLLVGKGARATEVVRTLAREGEGTFEVCAVVDGRASNLAELARRVRADVVVSAVDEAGGAEGASALLECRLAGLEVYDVTGFFERVLRRLPVRYLRASELALADGLDVGPVRRVVRRALDLVVASALLLLASPLMLVVAALIKLDSPGPVFYRQERVGRGGRVYRLWKFRSMRADAEKDGAVWARENDDRITRVGRFIRKARIDEIPQVFNVLSGDMSFVGPRPERPVFVAELARQVPFYSLREVVKPGITGWAQIRYPYGASVEDARNKLEYDLYYVKNGSLMLDLAIIFHTVRHVLLGRGAR